MILISDKGQQKGKHTAKENYWHRSEERRVGKGLKC